MAMYGKKTLQYSKVISLQLIKINGNKTKQQQQKVWFLFQVEKKESLSSIQLFVTPWTVAHQAPLSIEFSRQEYWSGLPFPSPG